ncbi:hypothetical protein Q8A67_019248 [Cirrhinus molitorella]|uniref:Uncharacterized protein n=1 Tax=Cirrhinus molitorella TaxID=172907 RepID=A0AA88THR6_9TELE|nr:hypothetical protein Q8A67_019248 [Cirrhinus molitorella]
MNNEIQEIVFSAKEHLYRGDLTHACAVQPSDSRAASSRAQQREFRQQQSWRYKYASAKSRGRKSSLHVPAQLFIGHTVRSRILCRGPRGIRTHQSRRFSEVKSHKRSLKGSSKTSAPSLQGAAAMI